MFRYQTNDSKVVAGEEFQRRAETLHQGCPLCGTRGSEWWFAYGMHLNTLQVFAPITEQTRASRQTKHEMRRKLRVFAAPTTNQPIARVETETV